MTTHPYQQVRGRVARFTLLDRTGVPVIGPRSVVTTAGIVDARIAELTSGSGREAIRSDHEKRRLLLREKTEVTRYSVDLSLLGTDPDLIEMLTGQPAVLNASGVRVGNDAIATEHPVDYAMEVWSKLARPVNGYQFGYTLFPRLRGGRVQGFSYEGGNSVSFSVTGAKSFRYSGWGTDPHVGAGWDDKGWDVGWWDTAPASLGWDRTPWDMFDWDNEPVDYLTPVTKNLHWRNRLVDFAPFAIPGAQPLLA